MVQEKKLHTRKYIMDQTEEMPYPKVREMRSENTVRSNSEVKEGKIT